ncbi:MAG: IS4 family transposase [Bacteroidia bacterium]|nr:IS4 family transposase [Bacteroidia bacterium]
MNITLFAQIFQSVSRETFTKLVDKYQSNKHCKGNDAWSHFVTMVFCQFSQSNSLNDVCNGMRLATGNLNHLGVKKAMKKSSLSYCNQHRNWELFRDMYYSLYDQLAGSISKSRKLLPKRSIYLLDSTTIDLSLKLYDWALFRQKKGAIKLHTVLDFDGCMPVFVSLSDGKKHDIKAAKEIEFPKDSVVVGDRGYVDFSWMYELDQAGVFFVVRGKENIKMDMIKGRIKLGADLSDSIQGDWEVELQKDTTYDKYPKKLRMVQVWDEVNNVQLELLTNNFSWTAETIAELYKRRWHIESFFKELKTHLKIKSFIGTSLNAVLIQIWTALITMLLLKSLQRRAVFKWNLSNLVNLIRTNLFTKCDLKKWLDKPFLTDKEMEEISPQLSLF